MPGNFFHGVCAQPRAEHILLPGVYPLRLGIHLPVVDLLHLQIHHAVLVPYRLRVLSEPSVAIAPRASEG